MASSKAKSPPNLAPPNRRSGIGRGNAAILRCFSCRRIVRFPGYNPLPKAETAAARLTHYRTAQGIAQEKLAKQLGIDECTLARWGRGARTPTGLYRTLADELLGDDLDDHKQKGITMASCSVNSHSNREEPIAPPKPENPFWAQWKSIGLTEGTLRCFCPVRPQSRGFPSEAVDLQVS